MEKNIEEEASKLLDQAFQNLTVVDEEKDIRKPFTLKQVQVFEDCVTKADELSPQTEDVKAHLTDYKNLLVEWTTRKFCGSKKLLIVSIVASSLFVLSTISNLFSSSPTSSGSFSVLGMVFGIFFLAGVVSYYWAYRAPVWLIDAKQITGKIGFLDFFKRAAGAVSRAPVNYTVYVDNYGNKVSDNYMDTWATKKIFALLLLMINIILMYMLLPVITIIGFVRFYYLYK